MRVTVIPVRNGPSPLSRCRWQLAVHRSSPDFWEELTVLLPPVHRYVLSGLMTSAQDMQAILASRPAPLALAPPRVSAAWGYGRDGRDDLRAVLDDLELMPGEAQAIADGADPLAVLLPRMRVRALSLEEMMQA